MSSFPVASQWHQSPDEEAQSSYEESQIEDAIFDGIEEGSPPRPERKACFEILVVLSLMLCLILPILFAVLIVEVGPIVLEKQRSCRDNLPKEGFVNEHQELTSFVLNEYSFSWSRWKTEAVLYGPDNDMLYTFQIKDMRNLHHEDILCNSALTVPNISQYCITPMSPFGKDNSFKFRIASPSRKDVFISGDVKYLHSSSPYSGVELGFNVGDFRFTYVASEMNSLIFSRIAYDFGSTDADILDNQRERYQWGGAISTPGSYICAVRSSHLSSKISLQDIERQSDLFNISFSDAEGILKEALLRGDTIARVHILTVALLGSQYSYLKFLGIAAISLIIFGCRKLFSVTMLKCQNKVSSRFTGFTPTPSTPYRMNPHVPDVSL